MNFESNSLVTKKTLQDLIDPLAALLSDPETHYADLLYMYFRIYKQQVIWRFLQSAIRSLQLKTDDVFYFTDVGASMGYDARYLINMLTKNFSTDLPFKQMECSLLEGDERLIELGKALVKTAIKSSDVTINYIQHPMTLGIPLPEQSQHVVLCSEMVEHLEHPEKLFSEIHRILKPGGFFMLTTDNSPSVLQLIKRIPTALRGNYHTAYAHPEKEKEISGKTEWQGQEFPIYGHINLNSTWTWEKWCRQAGFEIYDYGTYESIRRGGSSRTPLSYTVHLAAGAFVYYLMPRWLGRYFGDTTALLLQRRKT